MRTTTRAVLSLVAAGMATVSVAGAAAADDHETTFSANLTQLNGSRVHSTVWGTLTGDRLHLSIKSTGLAPGLPHPQHIHLGGAHNCPAPGSRHPQQDMTTSDAMGNYGSIGVWLTATGDSSIESGLGLDRFPTGNGTYERTFTVAAKAAALIRQGDGVIVQHGVDFNGDGRYDGSARSDLDPSLPAEATDPASCGVLQVSQLASMPSGGVQTGDGSTAGVEGKGLMVLGTLSVGIGGTGLVFLRRRRLDGRGRAAARSGA